MTDTTESTSTETQAEKRELAPGEGEFSLAKTKEIADRFRGAHVIRYNVPVAVEGDLEATLANLRSFVDPNADFASVLVQKFNGQGYNLDVQKAIKEALAPGAVEDSVSTEQALANVSDLASTFRVGKVRERKAAVKREGKVAQAEQRATKATETALTMYRALSKAQRKQYRQTLLDMGTLTEEQLAEVDNAE